MSLKLFSTAGLRFSCHQCGACCTGEPGFVFVTTEERRRLAQHLGLGRLSFESRYTRRVVEGISLTERPDGSCVFYDGCCTVYEVRPHQCRSYPFWPEIVESQAAWSEESRRCRGMGSGTHYDWREIEAILHGESDAASPEKEEGCCSSAGGQTTSETGHDVKKVT